MNAAERKIDIQNSKQFGSKEQLQNRLKEIFEQVEHQLAALNKVYQIVFPDWDKIERIEGYPVAGQALWKYICNLFIEFDRQHHPGIFCGGIWLNYGFSSDKEIDPWAISLENCRVIFS